MPSKPPTEERQIILARDHRRRYGARLAFRVLHPAHIGALANVPIFLRDGTVGHIRPDTRPTWDFGSGYELEVEGFATAAEAEDAGLRAAQALLLTALDLDFGVRLTYTNHHPSTVYDRTASTGVAMAALGVASWSKTVLLEKLTDSLHIGLRDRKLTLSMELLASSYMEANDRAKFIMAVSALEPLAEAQDLGAEVRAFVDRAVMELRADGTVPAHLRASIEARLGQLRKESVRQSLLRLCDRWFPNDHEAAVHLDHVYRLRSELLHEGAVADQDILLSAEITKVQRRVRRIYEQEYSRTFRVATAA